MTTNRTFGTTEIDDDAQRAIQFVDEPFGPDSQGEVPKLWWKVGFEPLHPILALALPSQVFTPDFRHLLAVRASEVRMPTSQPSLSP